jgi:hypothetical protein
MFLSERVAAFVPVSYTRIIGPWKVIQLHGQPDKSAGQATCPDDLEALHNLKSELTMREPGYLLALRVDRDLLSAASRRHA